MQHVLIVSIVVFSSFAFAAQPAKLEPLKGEMVQGAKLVLRGAGCALELPAADWKWMTYEGNTSQNYLCTNLKSGALYLVSVGRLHGDFTDHQPQSLIDNARRTLVARGAKLENDKFEWIELPGIKKCVRVTFTETDNAGKKTLAVIYIAQTIDQTSLKLQFTGPDAGEPGAFKQLAHSLKMIADDAAKPK